MLRSQPPIFNGCDNLPVLFIIARMIHELDQKLQLTEEELKTKSITIERQSHELEDRAEGERKQEREIQVCYDY